MITDYSLIDYGTRNEYMREMWIKARLSEIPEGYSILDAGAGDQHHKPWCSHLKYTSQDLGQYDGVGDGVGLQTKTYDYGKLDIISKIEEMPIDNESFDAVLCTEVLEHIPNPETAIKEMARVIKPEGRLIVTAPFCSITHFAPSYFETGFSEYWYKTILPSYGLKIESMEVYGDYFEYLAQELHRLYPVANTYCGEAALTNRMETDAINTILRMLERFSMNSEGKSGKLLCYGYLVVGKKEK
jgi:SAM-dependent methyltransferase